MQKSSITAAAFSIVIVGFGACARTVPSAPIASIEGAIDNLVIGTLARQRIPGMSVALVKDGRIAYAKGWGTISLSREMRPTADTQYRLASVSKPFTAVGVFQLVQDGKVALDAPARDYCPELSALNFAPHDMARFAIAISTVSW